MRSKLFRGYGFLIIAAILFAFPTFANRYDGYTGQYLVAFKMRQEDYFNNAVVYIDDNKFMGAIGYMLGKRLSDEAVANDIDLPQGIKDAGVPIYEGGPLGRDSTLFYLKHVISGEDEPSWQGYKMHAMNDEQLKNTVDEIVENYNSDEDAPRFLLFRGYSGWAPMQLEMEMMRGAWLKADELGLSLDEAILEDQEVLWHRVFKNVAKDDKKKLGKIY
ncbi:MAG: hypothetical protein CL561_11810 [Alphaproteobacteria bacterium]|nr:hypothetical protein [Alphaproteobacteria bacterium]|tara:strand:+ start:611 stop:1264 length:654 start_codon:yes stop_codon:yes gene_type:complete